MAILHFFCCALLCYSLSPFQQLQIAPFQWRFATLGLQCSSRSAASQELLGLACLLCPSMGTQGTGNISPGNPQYLCEVLAEGHFLEG